MALALSPVVRAKLLERLLANFEATAHEQVDALWAELAQERIDGYERGELRAMPAKEGFGRTEPRRILD